MVGGVSVGLSSMAGVTAGARLLRGGLRVVSVGSEKVSSMRLNEDARGFLEARGISEREWAVYWQNGVPDWAGDACGCLDDRCIGHHHAADEACGCIRSLVQDYQTG